MKKTIITLALALFAFSSITTSCNSGAADGKEVKDTVKEKKDSQNTMSDLEKEVGGEESSEHSDSTK